MFQNEVDEEFENEVDVENENQVDEEFGNQVDEEVEDDAGPRRPITTTEYVRKSREYYQTPPDGRAGLDKAPTPLEFMQSDDHLLTTIGPALQEQIDKITGLLRRHSRRSILAYYEVGAIIEEIRDDEEQGAGTRYGAQSMEKLGAALPWCISLLYEYLHLARTYTREQIELIAAMHLPSGQPLTWSHLRIVAKVTDPKRREDLLALALTKGWTAEELAGEYMRTHKAQKPPPKPRRPSLPRDLCGLVEQRQAYASSFLGRHDACREQDERLLARYFRKVREDQVTEEGAGRLEKLAADLRDMAEAAGRQAAEAEEVAREYRRRLEARAARGDGGAEDRAGTEDDPGGGEKCEAA